MYEGHVFAKKSPSVKKACKNRQGEHNGAMSMVRGRRRDRHGEKGVAQQPSPALHFISSGFKTPKAACKGKEKSKCKQRTEANLFFTEGQSHSPLRGLRRFNKPNK